jgi:hypothetical protein
MAFLTRALNRQAHSFDVNQKCPMGAALGFRANIKARLAIGFMMANA